MAKSFSAAEWNKVNTELRRNPSKYGIPARVYGSVVMASFNIRKLGAEAGRDDRTWRFLGNVCRNFDLIAVQEILEDLTGLERLRKEIGKGGVDYHVIVSDVTGVFPGDKGNPERLAFLYRPSVIERGNIVSDLTFDRTKVLQLLDADLDAFHKGIRDHRKAVKEWEKEKVRRKAAGRRAPAKPKLVLPFLGFIRQPYAVSFKVVGMPGTRPYAFLAVNAHLVWGSGEEIERDREFQALMEWIRSREAGTDGTSYPGVILLGDLNLDFDKTLSDFEKIAPFLKPFENKKGEPIQVRFPFLVKHRNQPGVFRTNARANQTYDQIGFFFRENQMARHVMETIADPQLSRIGEHERGPDYGMFNFVELFSQALHGKPFAQLPGSKRKAFYALFEHNVSDHMPLWVRVPLPD